MFRSEATNVFANQNHHMQPLTHIIVNEIEGMIEEFCMAYLAQCSNQI